MDACPCWPIMSRLSWSRIYGRLFLKAVSGKRLCYLIQQKGWQHKRIKGSHHIYSKAGEVYPISVPVHGNQSLKIGLQKKIMTVAGIEESEL